MKNNKTQRTKTKKKIDKKYILIKQKDSKYSFSVGVLQRITFTGCVGRTRLN